jgi:hypothetical protein
MFHDPRPHLGAGLFAGQCAGGHLRVHGLLLCLSRLEERLPFRCGVGAESGARTGLHTRVGTSTEGGTSTCAEARPTLEAMPLPHPTSHPHVTHALTTELALEVALLLAVLNPLSFHSRQAIDVRERARLQATLREGRDSHRGQRHGETKELDGAHLRLLRNVGATSPRWQWDVRESAMLIGYRSSSYLYMM